MKLTKDTLIEGKIVKKDTVIEVSGMVLHEDKADSLVLANKLIGSIENNTRLQNYSEPEIGYNLGKIIGEAIYLTIRHGDKYKDFDGFIKGVIKGIS